MRKKVLVIHPSDKSTTFLNIIYEKHLSDKNWTIVNNCNISKQELKDLIEAHDKVIMMGHGTPYGLINPQKGGFLVDPTFVPYLKEKETISIWCHSNMFFERFGMKGFHTGMIISEVAEADFVLDKTPLNKKETLENMIMFSKALRDCISKTPNQMRKHVLDNYVGEDEVTQYNRANIIVLDKNGKRV